MQIPPVILPHAISTVKQRCYVSALRDHRATAIIETEH